MIDEEIKKAYSKVTKQCETKSDRVSYKDAKNSFRAIREENEMEFSGVYHKTSEQMSYALDEDRLIVNIKTGYDVKQVFIHYGDPYEAGILGGNEKWTGKREEIIYKKRLPHQIWWTTTLFPEYKRCKYYFELRTEQEVWYYFEDGFLTEEQLQMDGRMQQCFIVPWMNPADINRTPAWVNDTIWYQIFPDRFCNGTPEKNGNDITPWRNHGTVTNKEKLDEIYKQNLENDIINAISKIKGITLRKAFDIYYSSKLAEQISGNKIKSNKLRDVFPPFHIPIEKSEVNYRLPRGDCGEIFAQFNAFLGL